MYIDQRSTVFLDPNCYESKPALRNRSPESLVLQPRTFGAFGLRVKFKVQASNLC